MMKTIAAILLLGLAVGGCDSVKEGPKRESPASPTVKRHLPNPSNPRNAPAQPGGSPYDTPPAKPSPYDTLRAKPSPNDTPWTRREAVSGKNYAAVDASTACHGKPAAALAAHSAAAWHSICLGGDVS